MAALSRLQLFRELGTVQDRIRDLFRRVVTRKTRSSEQQPWGDWLVPATDIRDTGAKLIYEVEIPGVEGKDLDVIVYGNVLTVRAERKLSREERKMKLLLSETAYRAFATSFTLPESADPDAIHASYANGVLTIEVAKHAWARPKQIPVQANGSFRASAA
jgi:HSP20 family protein